MSAWSYIKQGINYATIVGSAFAETGAVKLVKSLGTKGIRAGGKALPIINLVSAVDDIYQQHQIHNLQNTAEGLVKSQYLAEKIERHTSRTWQGRSRQRTLKIFKTN